ncbi:unnamed protein product [Heterobilharzia americana]|nr:unnamed protein product [Heterobilharzia americana]
MNIFSRLINAVKNAVFNAISPFFSSIYDFSTDYDSSSYDVVPKLEHYLAVGYLFTQQGFSDPLCKDSLIYLKTDQIEGLWHLRTCLLLLNKIYAGGNTQSSNTAYTLLSWEDAAAASRLNECHQAAKQLNLTLSLHSHLSGYEISKSIMHMFIAYQNVKRNKALNRSKAIGSDSFYWNFLYDDVHNSDDYIMSCQPLDWKFQQLNTILWNGIIHKCSKLPLFLLSSVYSSSPPFTSDPVHTNDVDDNDEKMLVTNFHSSDDIVIGMNLKSSDHRLKTRKIDRQHSSNEALVVPASLGGSQGATAYMRLSNRVRIIERNVSVSMRYLEELSQSYRRQMERLSRSFNLTYAWLKLTASGAEERDRQQQHRIAQLESQLNDLIARLKLRVLNSLPSSTVNQPDSTLTSTTTSSSPSGSPSPSVPCSSGSSTPSPTASRSVHLVAPPVPPPLPDFESSLDWNPWLKSHSVDWDVVVDDVGSDDAEFESDESFTQDDVYLSKSSQKEKSKQTSSSSSATSSSIAGSHSVGGVSSSSSDNGGSNPNAYSSESIFYPHSSAHHQDYSHKKSSSNWKQLIYDWLWIQFTWSMALLDLGLYVYKLCQENSTTCNTFSLVCLHLILASITHLFIYWTWLRPQNHKITFDTELFLSSLYRTLCSNKSHQNLSNIVIYFNPCHTRKTQATNNRLVTTSPLPPSPTDDCVTHEVEQDENNEQNRGESLGKASISNHTVSACCQLDNFLQCCRCKPSLSASSSSTVLIGGNSTDDFIQTDVIGNNYALEENTKTANNDDHSTELHDSGVINHKFSDICGITLIHHAHNCKVGMHLCDSKKDLKISSNSNLVSDNNSPSVDCINVALPGQSILSKQCNRHRQFLSLPELPTTSQLDHLKLESVISKCDEDYGMESVCQLRHNELMICPNSLSSMQTNASSSFSLTPPLSLCDHIGTTNSNDVNDGSHLHDKTLGLTANHHQSAENSISTWTSTFHKRNTRPNKRRRKRLSEINDSLCKF